VQTFLLAMAIDKNEINGQKGDEQKERLSGLCLKIARWRMK